MTKAQSVIAGLGFFSLAAMLSTGISAQESRCVTNLGVALSYLEKERHQFAFSTAINENGHFTTFTVDPDDRRWTMLVTMPNGWVCIVHSGIEWQPVLIGSPS